MKKTRINTLTSDQISVFDRGFNYGDGFFTTAKISDGQVEHWDLHCARLLTCQQRLGFSALDFQQLHTDVMNVIRGVSLAGLKIVITRGEGGRGYGPPSSESHTIVLSMFEYPSHYLSLHQQGIELEIASTRLGLQPLLAGLKTLNRLEQVLIKQEINDNHWQDAVVLDLNGHVIESSMANLIVVKGNHFFTPSLQNSGIQGVYLQHLTSQYAISVCTIDLKQLLAMDAVFCCNSLMGLIPVTRIQHRYFDLELAKQLKQKLEPSA